MNVQLQFASGAQWVSLRELTGHEERSISGTNTGEALQLIDALIVASDKNASLAAADLVAADRDRVLTALYQGAYGDRIEATLTCEGCGRPFDVDFSLRELTGAMAQRPRVREFEVVGENLFQAPDGWRFRLPTGRDEREAAAFAQPVAENVLLRRCMIDEAPCPDAATLQAALDELAPLVEFELRARCPECDRLRLLQFDIQTYLMRSLLKDQIRLTGEIHRLALAYGWSFNEILSLSRVERRRLVELIGKETAHSARTIQ